MDRGQFDAASFLDFFLNKLILQHMLIDDRKFSAEPPSDEFFECVRP